jgi:RNA polymerase sigma-70 factor (ECF subfamily)
VQSFETKTLEALQAGDENAFEMIFREHYQALCRYANSFLQDRDEAEEVVQSSFLAIWEKRNTIFITSSLKSYLYRAVRNSCLNVIKHEKIKQVHVDHEMKVLSPADENTSDAVLSNELEKQIYIAMQALPEQCRLVFKMSRFEELKYQEIADQLNISVKTVENQIGKALKIMREQLQEYLPVIALLMKGFLDG